jgi:hypothetical protein
VPRRSRTVTSQLAAGAGPFRGSSGTCALAMGVERGESSGERNCDRVLPGGSILRDLVDLARGDVRYQLRELVRVARAVA